MDVFYIPWMSSIRKSDDSSGNESELSIYSNVSSPNEPRYKLTFFPAKGMAEMSRMILAYANVPFIDNRIGFDEWEKKKTEVPFQLMPFLEYDGKILCQSAAIARFLAKQYGLAGKDYFEQAQVDAVIDLLKDFGTCFKTFVNSIVKAYTMIPAEFDNLSSEEALTRFVIPGIDRYMPLLEGVASNCADHGFLFPSGVTFADFALASFFEILETLLPEKMEPFKNVKALSERVFALPQLQNYLNLRPKTIF